MASPRGLADALFTHNALQQCEPSEKHSLELQHLVDEAESLGTARAGWLSPYYVNLAPDVTLKCRDCYARDPASRATAFATARAGAEPASREARRRGSRFLYPRRASRSAPRRAPRKSLQVCSLVEKVGGR